MIYRIIHPWVLQHPALLPWLMYTCWELGLGDDAPAYVAGLCAAAHTQVLLGIEEGRPKALLVTQLPTPLMLYPTILLGYNEGSKELGKALIAEAWAFIREAGFRQVQAMNRSGRSDAAYERGFRPYGKVIDRVTTFLVELKEEETDEVRPGDTELGVRTT